MEVLVRERRHLRLCIGHEKNNTKTQMDLLRSMIANRQAAGGGVADPKPAARRGRKPTKADRAKEQTPGTKTMRAFIIEEKPSKKVVKEHLDAIIDQECASSSEED